MIALSIFFFANLTDLGRKCCSSLNNNIVHYIEFFRISYQKFNLEIGQHLLLFFTSQVLERESRNKPEPYKLLITEVNIADTISHTNLINYTGTKLISRSVVGSGNN